MSPMLIKTISTAIMNVMAIYITKYVINSKIKIFSIKNILWIFFSLLPCLTLYTSGYDYTTFLTFFFLSLSLKNIFGLDITVATILVLYIMIASILPDLISSAIIINIMSFEKMRQNALIMLSITVIVCIITYCLFLVPRIRKFVNTSIDKLQKPEHRKVIVFGIFSFFAICITYYIVFISKVMTENYLMSNIIVLVFICLIFIYINEMIKYDKLKTQNNVLYECMQNVEEYQEQQDLKIHEYKNQLSKIAAITKNKKILKKLEKILQIDLTTDAYILGQLKYIPKGEIKSLIYYKLLVSSKKGLNILVDVSPKLKKENFNFSDKKNEELSQLLGIYFDNAIEAATLSEKKKISFEIYKVKENLMFVIMNTYKDKVNIHKMGKKGFSTKGFGRGKGLYFAQKIINNSEQFESVHEFIGDYYMQKIIIKKD